MSILNFGPYGTQAPDDQYQLALMMMKQMQESQNPAPVVNTPVQVQDNEALMQNIPVPAASAPQAPQTPQAPQPDPLAEYRSVMSREPGFFQENAPLILGLLGGISGLLEATGPSRVPISGGQVFARGLQSGLGGYMGGLKYQQGVESARQQEAANILNALGKEQNIQAALDKRKANNQLRAAIPQMIQDVSGLENLTSNDKVRIQIAKRLGESSPTSSFNILNEIAGRTDQFGFINTNKGTVIRTNK